MRKGILGVLLLALLFAWPAAAQEQRGAIQGVVKDAQGAVLPGVTVEVRSAAGAVITAVTDGQGNYRFPAVAPGNYTVTAKLSGFKTTQVEKLEVLLGQIKTVEFTLQVAGVSEEVIVKGEAPLVDTKQSARATSIRADQIDMLPKGRDFMSVVTQAPGANNEGKSGGVMIDGATTSENRYIVDGAETSNIVNGGSGKVVLPDFVEEVQVKSSGYTAEYGGATGGVINVITKSGTNSFRGNGLLYMENSKFITKGAPGYNVGTPTLRLNPNNSDQAQYITYAKDSYARYEPGISFGGPLLKDRAWFFGAYQPTSRTIQRDVTSIYDNSNVHTERKLPEQNVTANQTTQIGSKLRTRFAFNNSWSKTDGSLAASDGSDKLGTNYALGNTYPNYSVSGQADYVARQNFFVSARLGFYNSDQHSFGIPSDPRYNFVNGSVGVPGVPAAFQRTTGFLSIPTNSSTAQDRQRRLAFQTDATWYASFGGQHTIKGGFQVDRLANTVDSGEQGNYIRLYFGQSFSGKQGAYGYYRIRTNGVFAKKGFITQGDVGTNNYGLFIQDAWTINNKLTVNVGLRTEDEKVPPYTSPNPAEGIPTYGIQFGFKDKLAPRLGFAYDIKGDGKWKAYGSWGIFYDIFKMNLARGSFGGEKWLEYWYTLDTYDWNTIGSAASCPPTSASSAPGACPGTYIRGPVDYRHPSFGADAIDPTLKPMKSQEMSFGMEHQLTAVSALSLRYTHKGLIRAIDDTGSLDAEMNEIYVIANPGFGSTTMAAPGVPLPKAQRTYDAVEFAFTKNLSQNYYLRLSYQWSRLFGNYSGLDQTDENGRQSPNTGRLYDYPLMSFDQHGNDVEGVLATDRPHQLKAQFIYQFPFGTSLGINEYVASGIPKTREMAVIPGSDYPLFYAGRGSDGRMPVYSQTDLSVQHSFKVGGTRALRLSLNVLNLFNQRTATNFFATQNKSGYALDFNQDDFYAHKLDFAALMKQQGIVQDARFMMDSGYQAPIQARVGVSFSF